MSAPADAEGAKRPDKWRRDATRVRAARGYISHHRGFACPAAPPPCLAERLCLSGRGLRSRSLVEVVPQPARPSLALEFLHSCCSCHFRAAKYGSAGFQPAFRPAYAGWKPALPENVETPRRGVASPKSQQLDGEGSERQSLSARQGGKAANNRGWRVRHEARRRGSHFFLHSAAFPGLPQDCCQRPLLGL